MEKYRFPTSMHSAAANAVLDFFSGDSKIDTVLVVNSCARGVATSDSDLDFAILVKPTITKTQIDGLEVEWSSYADTNQAISLYKMSGHFSHLHLKLIEAKYIPQIWEQGVETDNFEIRIGNQICYSAPMGHAGDYFRELQQRWLPYYEEELRMHRLEMAIRTCEYDLLHIPVYVERGLYFHAFDVLCKAFREYLQALFIAYKTYPIAYNKWVKEQVVVWLKRPDLYARLLPILTISDMESNEIKVKSSMLKELLREI